MLCSNEEIVGCTEKVCHDDVFLIASYIKKRVCMKYQSFALGRIFNHFCTAAGSKRVRHNIESATFENTVNTPFGRFSFLAKTLFQKLE